jgi:hypothetical protein
MQIPKFGGKMYILNNADRETTQSVLASAQATLMANGRNPGEVEMDVIEFPDGKTDGLIYADTWEAIDACDVPLRGIKWKLNEAGDSFETEDFRDFQEHPSSYRFDASSLEDARSKFIICKGLEALEQAGYNHAEVVAKLQEQGLLDTYREPHI